MQRKPSTGMKALGCALILLGVAIIAVICLPMGPPMVGFASFAAAGALGRGITFFSSDKSLSEKMRKMNKKLDELTIKYQTSSADSPSKDAVISSATC
ncbi:hypothetical protein [Legionella fairfieldensis]|uniref:hypothetical protein n=1 Tax=Legionella fairfieldensis TaxID=45064 RepID=UPI00048F75B3|nr:hypothetical protein [Legionella fairfieldensis]